MASSWTSRNGQQILLLAGLSNSFQETTSNLLVSAKKAHCPRSSECPPVLHQMIKLIDLSVTLNVYNITSSTVFYSEIPIMIPELCCISFLNYCPCTWCTNILVWCIYLSLLGSLVFSQLSALGLSIAGFDFTEINTILFYFYFFW
jgi:hypothetical protein